MSQYIYIYQDYKKLWRTICAHKLTALRSSKKAFLMQQTISYNLSIYLNIGIDKFYW
jgi:hypothetical protein